MKRKTSQRWSQHITQTSSNLRGFNGQQTIAEALQPFAIDADKALGPDGFSASFFQSNWEIIGQAVINEIQMFFSTGCLAPSINKTHVRLIPKITWAQSVEDYKSIALCNIYYKIISKLLSIRLKTVLGSIISENLSAFIPGRANADNFLITHEVLHFLKTSKAEKNCTMAVRRICRKRMKKLSGCSFHKC